MHLDLVAVGAAGDAPRAASMRRRWLIEGNNCLLLATANSVGGCVVQSVVVSAVDDGL